MTNFEFGFPLVLWLLPAGILFWLLAGRSAANLPPFRRRVLWGVRSILFVVLLFALADPRIFVKSTVTHVVWVVDRSASVGEAAIMMARQLMKDCGIPSDRQSVVEFSGQPRLLESHALGKVSELGTETDLGEALQFATAVFPEGRSRVIVVVTDGVETRGDAIQSVPGLQASGVMVHSVPVEPSQAPEVLIPRLDAPRAARVNEPIPLRFSVEANEGTEALIEVFEDNLLAGSQTVKLKVGKNPMEITQRPSKSGAVTIQVRVTAANDTRTDNNVSSEQIMVQGRSRILAISENPSLLLGPALEVQGVEWESRPPGGLPSNAADLLAFDAVVLEEVPASALSGAQIKALVAYVQNFGGGLLMLGSGKSFGPGGYGGHPIEDLLPVRSAFQKQKEDPSLAIVPVMDSSGSMSGEKIQMAASAAAAAIQLLSPLDYAGVVAFDGEARWVADLQSAANLSTLTSRLSSLEAGGGTNIAAGLELAWEGLRRSPAKIKHVILLSDGVSVPGPFSEITARLVADKITLSTVGVGGDADAALLDQLARWGRGRYYHTDSPDNIPQIFARETVLAARPALRELPFQPVAVGKAAFLEGLDGMPPLLGFVHTEVKPGADLWMITESGDPLLATWRSGLGKTAAFTSDARDVWASEWAAWDGFGKFWAQVLREIRRGEDLKSFPITLQRQGDRVHVSVDALDPLGQTLPDLTGSVMLLAPGGKETPVSMEWSAPGRLEAFLPLEGQGPWQIQATIKSRDRLVASQFDAIASDYPVEFLFRPINRPLIESLAKETGGKFSPTAKDIQTSAPPSRPLRIDLWPWLVGLALLLFLLDVGLRRLSRNRRG